MRYLRDGQSNDQRLKHVPLAVMARVTPALSLSPATLLLGSVEVGAPSNGRLVVRAQTPFRITEVECEDARFKFQVSDAAKTLHFIPVTFQGSTPPGQVSASVTVHTDLGGGKATAATLAVNVREAAVSSENR